MNVGSERSRSLWMETAELPTVPELATDLRADVVVIGGGIAGLSAAYELAKEGRSVVVIDRGRPGCGMTARTTAHLASAFDDFYHEHIRLRGEAEARAYYQSQTAAIDRIDEIQSAEAIDCDFARLDGFLFRAPETDPDLLAREIEACHRIGFSDVAWHDIAPLGASTGPCLRFPRQARFHPLKYLAGLMRCILRDGGRLFADTAAEKIEERDGAVTVTTAQGRTISAGAAIVATNSPVNDWIAIHSKQAPYRTYVVAGRVPKGAVEDALYWDTLDAYHYVRLQPGGDDGHDWLIVGGEDHKTGHADDQAARFARLEAWARDRVPQFAGAEHRWSGQVMEPVDYAPYIGRNPGNERVFVVTGDSGEGMTTGALAGMLLRDMILDRPNDWAKAYEPSRVTLRAAGQYLRENSGVAADLARHLTSGEVASVDQLSRGQGAVLRRGARKIAAYRDDGGNLHLRSAACTHANCVVQWNGFEGCWDCPCHGSQFSVDGEVLNGPATSPLAEIEAEEELPAAE